MTVTRFKLQDDLAAPLEKSANELDQSRPRVIHEALRSYQKNQALEKKDGWKP